jgi:membrane-bound ClpP family serine protease
VGEQKLFSSGEELAMNLSWRDYASAILAVLGGAVVFAKIQGYSWALIGSWKGAVATLGVIGLLMLLLNVAEMSDLRNWVNWSEALLWILAAAFIVTGLFVASEAMFYSAAIALGVAWLEALSRHIVNSATHHHPTYVGSS